MGVSLEKIKADKRRTIQNMVKFDVVAQTEAASAVLFFDVMVAIVVAYPVMKSMCCHPGCKVTRAIQVFPFFIYLKCWL